MNKIALFLLAFPLISNATKLTEQQLALPIEQIPVGSRLIFNEPITFAANNKKIHFTYNFLSIDHPHSIFPRADEIATTGHDTETCSFGLIDEPMPSSEPLEIPADAFTITAKKIHSEYKATSFVAVNSNQKRILITCNKYRIVRESYASFFIGLLFDSEEYKAMEMSVQDLLNTFQFASVNPDQSKILDIELNLKIVR